MENDSVVNVLLSDSDPWRVMKNFSNSFAALIMAQKSAVNEITDVEKDTYTNTFYRCEKETLRNEAALVLQLANAWSQQVEYIIKYDESRRDKQK